MTEAKKEAEGTAPVEKREPSLSARAKSLILRLAVSIPDGLKALNDALGEEITLDEVFNDESLATEFTSLAAEFAKGQQRGLPLATRLANVQAEVAAHWSAMPVKDGKAVVSVEWQAKATELINKQSNIERAITKAQEKAKEATA